MDLLKNYDALEDYINDISKHLEELPAMETKTEEDKIFKRGVFFAYTEVRRVLTHILEIQTEEKRELSDALNKLNYRLKEMCNVLEDAKE